MSQVSIIIPTLNEAVNLRRTLCQLTLLNPPVSEVIVVDGGSEDETVNVAKQIFESFNRTLNVVYTAMFINILMQQPVPRFKINHEHCIDMLAVVFNNNNQNEI